ncbi:nitrilase-related carbon-nitrogen hydrolase [uncultured Micrococcus sp.]|uniref:nitrilase-related carbon-nitrogen hydrolase n=1 Tax=uncultured Micrococcus sp. TaxID=114051 RepID=UPI002594E390|nr:nitrilase-related carbon-nitrogen hydrolase [uncultured Micrococcus sp.]
MKIALAQISSTPDVEANLRAVDAAARDAAGEGARLVLFPEAATCAFDGDLDAFAADRAEAAHARLAALADELDLALVVGTFTPAADGRIHNTLLMLRPGEEPLGYDKIHLYDAFGHRESDTIAPGDAPCVVEHGGVRFGLATCYDVRFPALFTRLAREGAQVMLVAASWGAGPGKAAQWETLTRARALDSGALVAACDQAVRADLGQDPEVASDTAPLGVGRSGLIGPDGVDAVRLDHGPQTRVVELDLEAVRRFRAAVPVVENAREL